MPAKTLSHFVANLRHRVARRRDADQHPNVLGQLSQSELATEPLVVVFPVQAWERALFSHLATFAWCATAAWLHQQATRPQLALIASKLHDHRCLQDRYLQLLRERSAMPETQDALAREFRAEMLRF